MGVDVAVAVCVPVRFQWQVVTVLLTRPVSPIPENNRGMSAVLKNTIDWTSQPNVWRNKTVASIGASEDQFGTMLAQHSLRQTLVRVSGGGKGVGDASSPKVAARRLLPVGRGDSPPEGLAAVAVAVGVPGGEPPAAPRAGVARGQRVQQERVPDGPGPAKASGGVWGRSGQGGGQARVNITQPTNKTKPQTRVPPPGVKCKEETVDASCDCHSDVCLGGREEQHCKASSFIHAAYTRRTSNLYKTYRSTHSHTQIHTYTHTHPQKRGPGPRAD